jgi:hypothetical protein
MKSHKVNKKGQIMILHRPAYLAQITYQIHHRTPSTPPLAYFQLPTPSLKSTNNTPSLKSTPVTLEKPYTWKIATDLVAGDVFLTKKSEFAGELYVVENDSYDGVWLESSFGDMGYVDADHWFRVAR